MIISMQDLFSDDQVITGNAASTNYLDMLAMGTPPATGVLNPQTIYKDLGRGRPIPLLVQVTENFATCTSVSVAVQMDDNTSFSSPTTVMTSNAVAVASLLAGYRWTPMFIPEGVNERYVRLYYTVAGSNATTGKITACIGTETDSFGEAAAFRTQLV